MPVDPFGCWYEEGAGFAARRGVHQENVRRVFLSYPSCLGDSLPSDVVEEMDTFVDWIVPLPVPGQ